MQLLRLDMAHNSGMVKAVLLENGQHLIYGIGFASNQQTAAGLGVGQEVLIDPCKVAVNRNFIAITLPVSA